MKDYQELLNDEEHCNPFCDYVQKWGSGATRDYMDGTFDAVDKQSWKNLKLSLKALAVEYQLEKARKRK